MQCVEVGFSVQEEYFGDCWSCCSRFKAHRSELSKVPPKAYPSFEDDLSFELVKCPKCDEGTVDFSSEESRILCDVQCKGTRTCVKEASGAVIKYDCQNRMSDLRSRLHINRDGVSSTYKCGMCDTPYQYKAKVVTLKYKEQAKRTFWGS